MPVSTRAPRRLLPALALCAGALGCMGCQTLGDFAMVPLEMAEHVAVETVKLPYEAGKVGVRAMADAMSGLVR